MRAEWERPTNEFYIGIILVDVRSWEMVVSGIRKRELSRRLERSGGANIIARDKARTKTTTIMAVTTAV